MKHTLNFYASDDGSNISTITLERLKWFDRLLGTGDKAVHSCGVRGICNKSYEGLMEVLVGMFGEPTSSDNAAMFMARDLAKEDLTSISHTFSSQNWFLETTYTVNYNQGASYLWITAYTTLPISAHAEVIKKLDTLTIDDPPPKKGTVYMLMIGANGPEFRALPNRVNSDFVSDNYETDVMDGFGRIKSDLEAKKPHGRIGILDGPPGTGKTHLVRGLLTSVDGTKASFVFVSPKDVPHLADPSFLPALVTFSGSSKKSIIFVIEDADECLAPRGADNISAVSAILNLGDGILGELLDIRLVMTTNAKRQEFDAAITRPGRLSACVRVGTVSATKANKIFKRLTGKDGEFSSPATLAEVYSKASDVGFVSVTKEKTIGF